MWLCWGFFSKRIRQAHAAEWKAHAILSSAWSSLGFARSLLKVWLGGLGLKGGVVGGSLWNWNLRILGNVLLTLVKLF